MTQNNDVLADQPVLDTHRAPMPTNHTLRVRKNLPVQFGKFLAFDARIMRMVLKGKRH